MVTMPAGVRLEFVTDATEIELDVLLTRLELERPRRSSRPCSTSSSTARSSTSAASTEGTLHPLRLLHRAAPSSELGGPTTIALRPSRAGMHRRRSRSGCRRTPSSSCVSVRVSDGASVTARRRGSRRWVHHGSSISHCLEAARPTGDLAGDRGPPCRRRPAEPRVRRPVHARPVRRPHDPRRAGRPHQPQGRHQHRERRHACASGRSRPALHGFLDTIRDGHPTTPIVLVTPIVCPIAEDHPGPTIPDAAGRVPRRRRGPRDLATGALTLAPDPELIAEVVAARRDRGDEHLHLVDGLALFGPDDVARPARRAAPDRRRLPRRIGERFHTLVFEGSGPFARLVQDPAGRR